MHGNKLYIEWFSVSNRTYVTFTMKLNTTFMAHHSAHLLVLNNCIFQKHFQSHYHGPLSVFLNTYYKPNLILCTNKLELLLFKLVELCM